jgi:branched-chain amino acid transport system substrate-binding protein
MKGRRSVNGGRVALFTSLVVVMALVGCSSKSPSSTGTKTGAPSSGSAIKIAVLSDCQGDFGSFDNQDLAGVVAAMSQFAGGHPVDKANPRKGWAGASINGHELKFNGVGCSDSKADTAINETRRLVEQGNADIMIGPLSGDEGVAVANYAKAHPAKTFINGSAGAQDATLKVRAPNFFRFHGDGAQWNAGLGDLAYNKLHWKTAAIIADDYSFAWTSAAGFISEFCGVGGQVTKRVFPPLGTTDYSSYAQQLPSNVDGYFVAVGGAGLIPFLKAYEQAKGKIKGSKFIGNLFWGTPGLFEALGTRVAGAYSGGAGTAGDLNTTAAKDWSTYLGSLFTKIPPFGAAGPQAASVFTYSYYLDTVGLIKGLQAVNGDISKGQSDLQKELAKVEFDGPYGHVKLDENRQAVLDIIYQQLYLKNRKLAIKSIAKIPNVDQTFGGAFSPTTPAPGRTYPPCKKRDIPWAGKAESVSTTG